MHGKMRMGSVISIQEVQQVNKNDKMDQIIGKVEDNLIN